MHGLANLHGFLFFNPLLTNHLYLTLCTLQGCQYYITDDIRFHLYYIGAIGLGFGFFELTAALVAMQNVEGVI